MVAVGVPVAAMVILMGVFSGFDDLIKRMYRDFDPDMMVFPAEGKVFDPRELDVEAVVSLAGVEATSLILEERALAEYGGRQSVVTVRGVDSLFSSVVPIERMMWEGTWGTSGAVVGQGVAYELGVRPGAGEQLRFYVPSRGAWSPLVPSTAVRITETEVGGVFVLDAETDGEYVLAPIDVARELLGYEGMASGLAVRMARGASAGRLKGAVAEAAGEGFRVLSRYELKESMYRIMKMEKWGIFAIGLAVLLVASFSIVGSLVMLIIDKADGIRTLRAMGATTGAVRGVFIRQGTMIGATGALSGLALGLGVCALQRWGGVIPMPGSTFLVESYPVLVRWADVGAIVAGVAAVCWIVTVFTVRTTVRHE
jgi:lipoprotein-releasing system permease protein